jgi:hypothetical protein
MNRNRALISTLMVLSLIVLLAWQQQRAAKIASCQEKGGVWSGTTCRAEPGRILIQRDLRRS